MIDSPNQAKPRFLIALLLLAFAAVMGALPVWACDVPVFRFALERWPADPYQATIFHKGPLDDKQQGIVDWLDESLAKAHFRANVEIALVDVNNPGSARGLWQSQANPKLPWIALQYPSNIPIRKTVWAAPLTAENARAMLDSPKRREIARRITSGESAVWVMLESGDKAADNAAAKVLDSNLKKVQEKLKLPVSVKQIAADSIHREDIHPPLKLDFSILRVSRNDPREKVLVRMLLASESDLMTFDAPMVFPVFGRGRILYSLIGKGINQNTIIEAAKFVVGECSCEVKDLSPGTDLMLSVDWRALIRGDVVAEVELPPLTSLSAAVAEAQDHPEPEPIEDASRPEPEPQKQEEKTEQPQKEDTKQLPQEPETHMVNEPAEAEQPKAAVEEQSDTSSPTGIPLLIRYLLVITIVMVIMVAIATLILKRKD